MKAILNSNNNNKNNSNNNNNNNNNIKAMIKQRHKKLWPTKHTVVCATFEGQN